jgi:hypothetical protein
MRISRGLRLFGNSIAIDADQRRNNARGERAGGSGTTHAFGSWNREHAFGHHELKFVRVLRVIQINTQYGA